MAALGVNGGQLPTPPHAGVAAAAAAAAAMYGALHASHHAQAHHAQQVRLLAQQQQQLQQMQQMQQYSQYPQSALPDPRAVAGTKTFAAIPELRVHECPADLVHHHHTTTLHLAQPTEDAEAAARQSQVAEVSGDAPAAAHMPRHRTNSFQHLGMIEGVLGDEAHASSQPPPH